MRLPAAACYALIAAQDIVSPVQEQTTTRDGIARRHGLSPAYLGAVLSRLAEAGIITAARGRKGGYRARLSPAEVTVGMVLQAAGLPNTSAVCPDNVAVACPAAASCPVRPFWRRLDAEAAARLAGIPLGEAVRSAAGQDEPDPQAETARDIRLQAAEVLAGGVAYAFTDLITALSGTLALARLEALPGSRLAQLMEGAEASAEEAASMVRCLTDTVTGRSSRGEEATLPHLLRVIGAVAGRGADRRVDVSLEGELAPIAVDLPLVAQLLVHLIVSSQAASAPGTAIGIAAANAVVEAGDPVGLPPGCYVQIVVSGSGSGGEPSAMAACAALARGAGGALKLESMGGLGTTACLLLPAVAHMEETGTPRAAPRVRRRILVMDDEPSIRTVLPRILEQLGYDSEAVPEGSKAVEAYARALEEQRPFAAVILDLGIPGGMGGMETFAVLRTLDDNVQAVIATAHAEDPVIEHYREMGFVKAVVKPFRLGQLAEALSEAVGR